MEEKELYHLNALKVMDSKLLTAKRREILAEKIMQISKYKIIIILPLEIDEALNSDKLNLNWLEAHKSAEIINELNPDKAIIDCPHNNCDKYKAYLQKLVKNKKTELQVEHKADFNHKIVGAASILAKVTRDEEIKKLQKVIPYDIGSGYASDPITQKFLQEHLKDYEELVRKTWMTYKDLKEGKAQRKLGEYD